MWLDMDSSSNIEDWMRFKWFWKKKFYFQVSSDGNKLVFVLNSGRQDWSIFFLLLRSKNMTLCRFYSLSSGNFAHISQFMTLNQSFSEGKSSLFSVQSSLKGKIGCFKSLKQPSTDLVFVILHDLTSLFFYSIVDHFKCCVSAKWVLLLHQDKKRQFMYDFRSNSRQGELLDWHFLQLN